MNIINLIDGYKLGHIHQYPPGTTLIYSNWTARNSLIPGIDKVVFFGLQYFIKEYLLPFGRLDSSVFSARIEAYLGQSYPVAHLFELQKLGYYPLEIKSLPEGSLVPLKVPMLTIKNTHPDFYWLTNYIETLLSNILWKPCVSATLAYLIKSQLDRYAKETGIEEFVKFQGHDFSMRGMSGLEAAQLSGASHLLSFVGTDTIPVLYFLQNYYNVRENNFAFSVPATEHSVMSMYGKDNELECLKRLITYIYPGGVVSIVSDTWDLWKLIKEYLPKLKEIILARNGKVVIRPDSGNPEEIIRKCLPLLWEIFGGTIVKGYKLLDSHIGLIYGDGISLNNLPSILEGIKSDGFSTSNVVFGIGSYTYQYNSRDTFGFAVKSTYGEINGIPQIIYKDPVTDNGVKKSAKGLLQVYKENGEFKVKEEATKEEEAEGELKTIFLDGKLLKETSFVNIKNTLWKN